MREILAQVRMDMLLLALKHAQRSAREEEMKKCNPVTTWSSEMAQASQPRLGEYGKRER